MTKKVAFLTVVVALMLTACTNKPFSKFASKQQEGFDTVMEMTEKLKKMDVYSEEASEFNKKMNEKMEALLEEMNEAAKASIGTDVDTETTSETGITLDGNFRIADVVPGSDPTFLLKVKAKVADATNLRNVYVFGYEGNTPLLPLGSCPNYELDGEKDILLFPLHCDSDDPELPKRLGRITRIVLSTDEALYDQLKQEWQMRKDEMKEKFFQ